MADLTIFGIGSRATSGTLPVTQKGADDSPLREAAKPQPKRYLPETLENKPRSEDTPCCLLATLLRGSRPSPSARPAVNDRSVSTQGP